MFSFPQNQQALPQYSDIKIPEYQGNLHRSQERLIQSLLKIPSHWKLIPCINKIPLGRKWGCVAKNEMRQQKSRRRKRFRQLIRRFD